MTSDRRSLLATPGHRTNRYALPGARLHHRRPGYIAVEEPENTGSWFGHRLIVPRSPFVEGLDRWLERWRAERLRPDGTGARPPRAYLAWETAERDVGAEAACAAAGIEPYVLRLRRITDSPARLGRTPPPGPPGLACRPLTGEADWAAAARLSAQAFGGEDEAQAAFAGWAVNSRRRRVEAGQGVDWGAFLGAELVGHCGLMFDPDDPAEARFQDVAAAVGFAGRKIVSNLLAAALEYFFAGGGRAAWILVDADARAERIYAALGFEPVSWFYELGLPVEWP